MGKSVKRNMLNAAKHAAYDHEIARHISKKRIVQDQESDKYFKKYRKFDDYEDYDDD